MGTSVADPADVVNNTEVSATGWATPPARPALGAHVGEIVGSYRLLEVVGSGGMGCVYRAEHVRLGRSVAIKILHRHHARRREQVARLFQEARASSQIQHRNIVDIVDYLEPADDLACLVMEFLPGPSLRRLMSTPGELPAERALDIVSQMCDGLAAAHQAGIVHRDLKPDNVLVIAAAEGGGDLVKILDFGAAKLLDSDEVPLTAAGQVIGTPAYMAPEHAGGLEVDPRADIYSLGAIMYELFAGQTPFVARTFDEFAFKHMTAVPSPLADIDPRIEAIIMRCLEKDPERRFASMGELRSEIAAIRAPMTASQSAPVQAVAAPPAPTSRLGRPTWFGLAATGALLSFVAVWLAVGAGRDAAHAAAPPPVAGAADRPARGPEFVRIISQPPGRVYPGGRDRAMCKTPCAIAVAPAAGRAARPVYFIRRPGYRDQAIALDPDAPPSQVKVRLEREPRPAPRRQSHRNRTLNPYRDEAP